MLLSDDERPVVGRIAFGVERDTWSWAEESIYAVSALSEQGICSTGNLSDLLSAAFPVWNLRGAFFLQEISILTLHQR